MIAILGLHCQIRALRWHRFTSCNFTWLESSLDGWPLWVLKEMTNSICIPLSILYSRSLDTGVLPKGWKKGHVTPVQFKRKVVVVVQTFTGQLHLLLLLLVRFWNPLLGMIFLTT